ncbi:MAG: hypothetical protein ACSLEN_08830 [Candidatus Malihini olakiniferum]
MLAIMAPSSHDGKCFIIAFLLSAECFIIMLKDNRSVTQVALDLDYFSTASFTFVFRQMFGVPPTRYHASSHDGVTR